MKAKRASKKPAAEALLDPHDHLRQVDAKLAKVIERSLACPLLERAKEPPNGARSFHSLVHAIVSQQLSGKAADTIFGRLEALGGGALPSPKELLAIADEALRKAGLSAAKTRGVKDLASRVESGSLDLETLHLQDDEAVIERLTQVKGIGRWTAEMFLMFRLGRPDVLSTADLGLRKGLMILHDLPGLPAPDVMVDLTRHWRPYRSVGSWFLWRVAESAPPVRKAPQKEAPASKRAVKKPSPKKKAPPKAPGRAAKVLARR